MIASPSPALLHIGECLLCLVLGYLLLSVGLESIPRASRESRGWPCGEPPLQREVGTLQRGLSFFIPLCETSGAGSPCPVEVWALDIFYRRL